MGTITKIFAVPGPQVTVGDIGIIVHDPPNASAVNASITVATVGSLNSISAPGGFPIDQSGFSEQFVAHVHADVPSSG